jgi:catechol 2,3-dioxygenase-like lactoylglutathione lyase family enzyme
MITGAHTIIYCKDAEKARAFFKDTLKFPHVDAGRGWLIFALPPAEVAAHPAEGNEGQHQLYLMCDDIQKTVTELKGKGVEFVGEISDQRWGILATMKIPGGGEMGLYQPRHPIPTQAKS